MIVLIYFLLFISMFISGIQPAESSRDNKHQEDKTEPEFRDAVIRLHSSEEFKREVLFANNTSLVEFYSDWCSPCRKMAPILNEFAINHSEKITVFKVNHDYIRELVKEYKINAIPTVVLFKNGMEIDRVVGFRNYIQLKIFVSETLMW